MMATATVKRRKYRYPSREAAENALRDVEQKQARMFWLLCATESGSLVKIGRKCEYSIQFVPSPRRHCDFYCLRFVSDINDTPSLQFYDSRESLRSYLSNSRNFMDSQNPDALTFDCLISLIQSFVEPA